MLVAKWPHAPLTETGVIAHCRVSMTGYKAQKIVCFVKTLPKNTVVKILRRELRNEP